MSQSADRNRRTFMARGAAWTSGLAVAASAAHAQGPQPSANAKTRLPREVRIATVAQEGIRASTPQAMIQRMLQRMERAAKVAPDVICLPELFPFSNLDGKAPDVAQVAQEGIGPILQPFAKFALEHHCHVICPVYTKRQGHYYNSVVFLDRSGNLLGDYHKIHPTTSEMEAGVSPGPVTPSVFTTDFGRVGAQICFDIQWDDGWQALQKAGAEIVFWPSAFAGGQMINARAWNHRYCVVSSTNKDVSKICDVTGDEVAATSRWHHWASATINLEKAFLHTWPYVNRFDDVVAKYGPGIRIRTCADEEWSIIESLDPAIRVQDVLREFELRTMTEHLEIAQRLQDQRRPKASS
jgi:predicted amidohydrolase